MNPKPSQPKRAAPIIGLLSNGKHNADHVLKWFGERLATDFGAQVHFREKAAPSGPAESEIIDRMADCDFALVGTAD